MTHAFGRERSGTDQTVDDGQSAAERAQEMAQDRLHRDLDRDENRGGMERPQERMGEAQDKAKEKMGQAQDMAKERMGQAKDQAEHGREKAADGAHTAAERIRDQAEGRGGMQEKVGVKAADAMERTAGYLRENRTDEIWDDIERLAREHPMQALGGAVVAGFVIGRILR